MIKEEQNTNFHEYCEQEGISHDDVINKEIEQEHKECRDEYRKIEFEKPNEEIEKVINEKINNPNYFPMFINFNLETIRFIDMTEFNSKTYRPHEIEEAKKKYIKEKLEDELRKTLKELRYLIEKKEYCPISLNVISNTFFKSDFLLKDLFAKAIKEIKDLIP